MKNLTGAAMIVAAGVALAGTSLAAVSYDLATQFNTSNPDGPWSYRSGETLLPYQPLASQPPLGLPGPEFGPGYSYGNYLPQFWQSDGPGSDIAVQTYDPGNGSLATGEAIVDWTAPLSGEIDVSGYMYYVWYGFDRSNDFQLSLGNQSLQTGTAGYANAEGPSNKVAIQASSLPVNKGDILSLEIYRTPGLPWFANYGSGDNFDLTISYSTIVPEPSSWAHMILGIAAIGLLMRQSKRAVFLRVCE